MRSGMWTRHVTANIDDSEEDDDQQDFEGEGWDHRNFEGGISLSYRVSLSVEVQAKGDRPGEAKMKTVLDDVCGVCEPGQLVAVMGPSGSGKTTLLNCLSLRNKKYRGRVWHNGGSPDLDTVAINSAFVQQEDLFIAALTPREHLSFNASLRMAQTMTEDQRREAVENSLKDLGLVKCADTMIGGQGSMIRGLSGGQKKRLSFAAEMLGDPKLIFADEPTSGLDSDMAEMLVLKMRSLAQKGKVVVATIHQPSSQVFSFFSSLHLLAEGRTIYSGPREEATKYFDRIGYPCPPFFNPADFFLSVLSTDEGFEQQMQGSSAMARQLARVFKDSEDAAKITGLLPLMDAGLEAPADEKVVLVAQKVIYQVSWIKQVLETYNRTILMYSRDPLVARVKLTQIMVGATVIGVLFFQLDKIEDDVQSAMGLCFFATMAMSTHGVIAVIQVFILEMPVFLQEYDSGLYSMSAYFIGRSLGELPMQSVLPLVYSSILLLMTNVVTGIVPGLIFMLMLTLGMYAGASLGYLMSTSFSTATTAMGVGHLVYTAMVILGHFVININTAPAFVQWMSVASLFRYVFAGISITVWHNVEDIRCVRQDEEPCLFPDGRSVLEYLGFEGESLAYNVAALVTFIVVLRLFSFGCLAYRFRNIRAKAY